MGNAKEYRDATPAEMVHAMLSGTQKINAVKEQSDRLKSQRQHYKKNIHELPPALQLLKTKM